MTLSEQLAGFAFNTDYASLPQDIIKISHQHLLDTVGCCLAGTTEPVAHSLGSYIEFEGGSQQATAIGLTKLLPVSQAGLYNGFLARAKEFDDMVMPDLHPGGVIIPTVLAVAEVNKLSGKEVLTSIAIGMELLLRLGRAGVDPIEKTSLFLRRGQDSSAICGTLAASVVAAKLLKLNQKKIAHALGIATSFAAGSLEANRSGGNIKQFQSGWAAKAGIEAALLANYGVSGPSNALEGRYGFYQCFIDGKFDANVLTQRLHETWLLREARFKPYPANYYTHSTIDAALLFRSQGLKPQEVEAVEIAVATAMCRTIGEPLPEKQNPKTAYAAKFSAPYAFAAALIGGHGLGMGLEDYSDDLVLEPKRMKLMQHTKVITDPRCDKIFPAHAPAIVTVTTKKGNVITKEILVNRASKEKPLTEIELARKFKENAGLMLADTDIERLYDEISNVASIKSIHTMMRLLRKN